VETATGWIWRLAEENHVCFFDLLAYIRESACGKDLLRAMSGATGVPVGDLGGLHDDINPVFWTGQNLEHCPIRGCPRIRLAKRVRIGHVQRIHGVGTGLVPVGEASRLLNIHRKTLICWDHPGGCLRPVVRTPSGRRLYSLREILGIKGQGDLLKLSEAARMIGVSNKTLKRWDISGRLLPNVRWPGKYRMYLRPSLLQFIRSREGSKVWTSPESSPGLV